MQAIGFFEKHDTPIKADKYDDLSGVLLNNLSNDEKELLAYYLKNCTILMAFIREIFDGNIYIAPYIIYSDGEWIWPSHYFYYLNKGAMLLNTDFLNYLRSIHFQSKKLLPSEKLEVDKYIAFEMLRNMPKDIKIRNRVKRANE